MRLHHGTSDVLLDAIHRDGLNSPSLTNDPELADYYAGCVVDEEGGEGLILAVDADETRLRVDVQAIEEPVLRGELRERYDAIARQFGISRDEALWRAANDACAEHGVRGWTDLPWQASLALTGCVNYRGQARPVYQ